jgi:hypothetical protein
VASEEGRDPYPHPSVAWERVRKGLMIKELRVLRCGERVRKWMKGKELDKHTALTGV